MKTLVLLLLLLVTFYSATGIRAWNSVETWSGQLNYTEDWGYANIRPKAHTFWWLYAVPSVESRPLILWLQGGPGADSTAYGNLEEIGPKDLNGNDRMSTWLQLADLVFVDNPVGTGFSFVENGTALTKNIADIGEDLFKWAQQFFTVHPEYKTIPFYIFTESYGGKMGAEFARLLFNNQATLDINLAGVALGDAWISPADFIYSYGPFLHEKGLLDDEQLMNVTALADLCQNVLNNKEMTKVQICHSVLTYRISKMAGDISLYNIRKKHRQDHWSKKRRRRFVDSGLETNSTSKSTTVDRAKVFLSAYQYEDQKMKDFMDDEMREKFGIIPDDVKFGAQSLSVRTSQREDIMVHTYETVDELLMNGVNVIVYVGELDFICNSLGTEFWIDRLTWPGQDGYKNSEKTSFSTNSSHLAGYSRIYKNFQYYEILGAGHMVPHDAGEASLWMVKNIMQITTKM